MEIQINQFSYRMKAVTIYTTPNCVYCKMAKSFFNEKGIQYKELNVESDAAAREEMFAKSEQMGVPVIDVGGDIYVGFSRAALAEALGVPA
jgi:glutaredoxin 3